MKYIAEFGFRHLQLFKKKTAIWKKTLFNISGIDFDYMLKKMTFNFLLTLALSDMKKYHPQGTAQNTSVTNGESFFLGNSKSFKKKWGCIYCCDSSVEKIRGPIHTCILTPSPSRLRFFEFVWDISITNRSLTKLNHNISRDRQRFHVFDVWRNITPRLIQ